ncbi:MAG TPA: DUF2157 domain-containing protein [Candidatus Nanoarchaeia archaeon]|nr:DUF2157 domain-containing protein [Candidatus Nanoarchaeia archaeon]
MPTKDSLDKIEKYKFLLSEARKLANIGVISKEQLQKIYSLYKDPQKAVEAKHWDIVSIIAIFGSLMIGAGIILFFALNWSSIPKLVKVFSILAALVASYYVGYTMKFSKANFPNVGGALIFLGAIIFGAGIFLVGQIFNINSHWPSAFLYWALGIVALAYITQSKPVMYLSLLTAGVYVGSEMFYWFNFVDRYYNISYAFFLIFLSLGISYYMLGNLHEKKESIRMLRYPFHLIGSFLIMLTAYLFSFKWFGKANDFGYSAGAGTNTMSVLFNSKFWIIYLAVTLVAIIFIFISFKYRDTKDSTEFHEVLYLGLLLVFTPLVVLFSKINFWMIPITFNIILFLLIVGSVYLGYAKREKTLVNLGMIAFGVAIFSRYIEYLWDVLNGYLFFIIGGVLLIVLAIILEKNRRKIIDRFTG